MELETVEVNIYGTCVEGSWDVTKNDGIGISDPEFKVEGFVSQGSVDSLNEALKVVEERLGIYEL